MTQQDSPKIARRRDREKRTISQMVALNCADNHDAAARTETAHCGEAVCPGCASIDAYAVLRTERCRKMDVKTSCDECEHHCYKPEKASFGRHPPSAGKVEAPSTRMPRPYSALSP